MLPLKSLSEACKLRDSVFEPRASDTVYNLDDLDRLNPRVFFAENYLTEGMRLLLTEAFKRLEGKSSSAAGTFLLSQSMGGGKTHNLIALGLLPKYPEWRSKIMSGFYSPGPMGAVRVVAFSGRKTNTPFGIWGEVAEQLDKKEALKNCYTPLRPPGPEEWEALLRGDPKLVLFDELPPYFEAAKAIPVGSTHLDTLTTTALANFLIAVNDGKLSNVCVVLTDLSGTAYNLGSAAVSEALANLQREVNRQVVRIDPVRLNTNELYQILRVRLFEQIPEDESIDAVAEAYRQELERAKLMDITAASPDQLKADIKNTYPFHPAIRDLYARFKENPGFQQTRALIRMMRLCVATLWRAGAAQRKYLIGAHDFDLHEPELLSEIRQINPTLEVAIAHDIAVDGGGSIAEQMDAGREGPPDAQDVSKLIFLASLSQAINPTLGLERSEIVRYLAAPARDLTGIPAVIDRLQTTAWYLHPSSDSKLLFKNTENLVAKLDTYTRGRLREQREEELRNRLRDMFKPVVGACYQRLEPLPALDEVDLDQDMVALVVFRPSATALEEIRRFWEHQQYKNRVLFLTGGAAAYETVLQRAAELSAIRTIIAELHAERRLETDPQLVEAQDIQTKKEALFYQACRETFQTLYYPARSGLVSLELEPQYAGNAYKGEEQVIKALKGAFKYREDTGPDTNFRTQLENKLWLEGVQEILWSDVKRRAATDPSWVLHHPKALDTLKAELVNRDIWREHGNYVERGPFPKPATSVTGQLLSRDEKSGQVTLRVKPLHADTVYWSEGGPATPTSPRLEQPDLKTTAVRLWFLAVDSTGEHRTGEPFVWTNTITVKHRFFQDGQDRRCELQAIPCGTIRYTTDGSTPDTASELYTEPFVVPGHCRFILAVAEQDGVRSAVTTVEVPSRGSGKSQGVWVDPQRSVVWRRRHQRDDTNGTYTWLELAAKYGATLGGIVLQVARGTRWVELRIAEDVRRSAQEVIEDANRLKELVPDGSVNLEVDVLHFGVGRDLQDMVRALKTELQAEEVVQ